MSVLGVIPVAGKGSRWGGYYKELLPTGDGEWFLDRTISSMKEAGADKICVVTTIEKMTTHATHIKEKYDGVFYVIQREHTDIWGAMKESLPFATSINLFAMPDTYFPKDTFSDAVDDFNEDFQIDFYLGMHETNHPERFGVIVNDVIKNKSTTLPKGATYTAWGTLLWTRQVAEFWMARPPSSYTDAINAAMAEFRWGTFPMAYYLDMARWEDYGNFIRKIK
ncbi:hypothetical protein KAR91_46755 [Candidatus Pacearchaeota archaeon]|nr:hypothetical protein [Candidatus Pacearchaeota archaeon]